MRFMLVILSIAMLIGPVVRAERIKDITDIEGERSNLLQGIGLVVGLSGTGDDSELTRRMFANFLRRTEGLALEPDDLTSKNVAAVMVEAVLTPYARCDTEIPATASATGASSLQGGILLMTPLKGADGRVYAVAGGALTIGGFGASGSKSTITKNHITVGQATAIVEKEELATYVKGGRIGLLLKNPDFATAENIAQAINELYPSSSSAVDAGKVRVTLPKKFARQQVNGFITTIGSLQVQVDSPAVVVVNEKTGTIIIGQNVRISNVAIVHGSLSIITQEKDYVSQPLPFSRAGTTAKTERTDIKTIEEGGEIHVLPKQPSVSELARALNAIGRTPRGIISIFQELKAANALQAELKIM